MPNPIITTKNHQKNKLKLSCSIPRKIIPSGTHLIVPNSQKLTEYTLTDSISKFSEFDRIYFNFVESLYFLFTVSKQRG